MRLGFIPLIGLTALYLFEILGAIWVAVLSLLTWASVFFLHACRTVLFGKPEHEERSFSALVKADWSLLCHGLFNPPKSHPSLRRNYLFFRELEDNLKGRMRLAASIFGINTLAALLLTAASYYYQDALLNWREPLQGFSVPELVAAAVGLVIVSWLVFRVMSSVCVGLYYFRWCRQCDQQAHHEPSTPDTQNAHDPSEAPSHSELIPEETAPNTAQASTAPDTEPRVTPYTEEADGPSVTLEIDEHERQSEKAASV